MTKKRSHRAMTLVTLICAYLLSWASSSNAQSWTPLIHLSPDFTHVLLLLTDGTVMVQGSTNDWMRLTPDATGNYIAGSWSMLASMSTPRLYFASNILTSGKLWILGGEYSGPGFQENWTATAEVYDPITNSWSSIASYPSEPGCPFVGGVQPAACFGDDPSMLLPGGRILAGDLISNTPHIYDIASDTWSAAGKKVYNDQSDEEGWVKLSDGTIITYDIFHSVTTGGAYAERYEPATNTWLSISPSDGTADGSIPQLSSQTLGYELGPLVRLQDGRVLVLGASGHTALYTLSTNTWAAGPDIIGALGCGSRIFGADDAPAAVVPSGHVIFSADAGPDGLTATASITLGSAVITGIASTACLRAGWSVSGSGIPSGATIMSVDSPTQVTITNAATATRTGALAFGGVFSSPTQLFDFDPTINSISPVSPPVADSNLLSIPAFPTRMLVLPTGQVLFSDGSRQLWVYTPVGAANLALRPSIAAVSYIGGGVFTLGGRQLNGQSAGSAYGDDVESDENFPIIRLRSASGQMFYARTTNWSTTGVATGSTPETVNFTLPSTLTVPGTYALQVVGAGIGSVPIYISVEATEIAGQ